MNGYGKDDWILTKINDRYTTSDKKWPRNGPEMDRKWTKYFQNGPEFCNLTRICMESVK